MATSNGDSVDFRLELTLADGSRKTSWRSNSYAAPWTLKGLPGMPAYLQGDEKEFWTTPGGVELNYVETHAFNIPPTTSLDGSTLSVFVINHDPGDISISLGDRSARMDHKGGIGQEPRYELRLTSDLFPLLKKGNVGVQHLTLQPWDGGGAPGQYPQFGSRVICVLTGPRNGYWGGGSHQTPWPENAEIFKVSDGSINQLTSHWQLGTVDVGGGAKNYYALFVGGLYRKAGGSDPLVLMIDGDCYPSLPAMADPKVLNLSSSYVVWDIGDPYRTDVQRMKELIKAYNNGNFSDIPNATCLGCYVKPSSRQLIVAGNGRINGWQLVQQQDWWSGGVSSYEEGFWSVGGEMLRFSSNFGEGDPTSGSAIDLSGVTVAWTPRLHQGTVELNSLDKPMVSLQDAWSAGFNSNKLEKKHRFPDSSVKLYDYKQFGSWVGQSDGPETMSWKTRYDKVYLHVSDDSVKVRSPECAFHDITILQGSAGFPVSYAYGLVNQGVYRSHVNGLYLHRIMHPKPDQLAQPAASGFMGIVWMGIVPAANVYYTALPTVGKHHPSFTDTWIAGVYVPSFIDGGADMNSVGRGMTVTIQTRLVDILPSITGYQFEISNIGIASGGGHGSIYDDWKIGPKLLDQQGSRVFLNGSASSLTPVSVVGRVSSFDIPKTIMTWPNGKQATVSGVNNQLYWGSGGDVSSSLIDTTDDHIDQ